MINNNMDKCDICGIREYFRVLKKLKMCIFCFNANINKSHYSTETKATEWDKDNLVFKKRIKL